MPNPQSLLPQPEGSSKVTLYHGTGQYYEGTPTQGGKDVLQSGYLSMTGNPEIAGFFAGEGRDSRIYSTEIDKEGIADLRGVSPRRLPKKIKDAAKKGYQAAALDDISFGTDEPEYRLLRPPDEGDWHRGPTTGRVDNYRQIEEILGRFASGEPTTERERKRAAKVLETHSEYDSELVDVMEEMEEERGRDPAQSALEDRIDRDQEMIEALRTNRPPAGSHSGSADDDGIVEGASSPLPEYDPMEAINQKLRRVASRIRHEQEDDEIRPIVKRVNELSNRYINLGYDESLSDAEWDRQFEKLKDDTEHLVDTADAVVANRYQERSAAGQQRVPKYDRFQNYRPLENPETIEEAYKIASASSNTPDERQQWSMERKLIGASKKVYNWDQDVWDTSEWTESTREGREQAEWAGLDPKIVENIAQQMADGRCAARECRDAAAVDEARRAVEDGIYSAYAEGHSDYSNIRRNMELFDRAYGAAFMRNQGVDLDQHPELRSYQTYYDAGMPPPTHEEMANWAIEQHGNDSQDSKEPTEAEDTDLRSELASAPAAAHKLDLGLSSPTTDTGGRGGVRGVRTTAMEYRSGRPQTMATAPKRGGRGIREMLGFGRKRR